ncbi:hypothetical protein [Paraburkholderia tropica]|uniref:hypothetical protein n=1 Tax=Paraburkholderia tropica TaxID=92647 RepID=UPI003D2DD67C
MSPFLAGLIIGFFLGTFAWGVLVILIASHRTPPPTMRRRFQGQALPDGVDDSARAQPAHDSSVQYRFMGVGNEEI